MRVKGGSSHGRPQGVKTHKQALRWIHCLFFTVENAEQKLHHHQNALQPFTDGNAAAAVTHSLAFLLSHGY